MVTRLGLDFGGVITVLRVLGAGDTQVTERDDLSWAQPNALNSITNLVAAVEGRVWIVPKAGPRCRTRRAGG